MNFLTIRHCQRIDQSPVGKYRNEISRMSYLWIFLGLRKTSSNPGDANTIKERIPSQIIRSEAILTYLQLLSDDIQGNQFFNFLFLCIILHFLLCLFPFWSCIFFLPPPAHSSSPIRLSLANLLKVTDGVPSHVRIFQIKKNIPRK